MHAVVRFDAAAPFVGAERDLYQDLVTLLRDRRAQLEAVIAALAMPRRERRSDAAARIAELLVDVAATRRTLPAAEFDDAARRAPQIAALQQAVSAKAQRCTSDLLALYGFREGDAAEAALPLLEGRWSMDFFSPEALKDASLRLGKGAAVGVAVGVVADLALAGLSLGAGAALGGAIGGAISQGWGPLGRKLANKLRDVHELTVEDRVLFALATWQLQLAQALERRGHAATQRISTEEALKDGDAPTRAAADAVRAVHPARNHPEWEAGGGVARHFRRASPQREALVGELSHTLQRAFAAR
jgi:hypothetical protein